MKPLLIAVLALFAAFTSTVQAAPENFSQAKRLLRQHVYNDQNAGADGTFYCGCDWSWVGKSGGQINLNSCGYKVGSQPERAARLEWEHTVAISAVGQQRQCWQRGGRENCQKTDPVFNRIEADMHNLVPAIGEVNAIRSNINLGMVSGPSQNLGACATKVAVLHRAVEPRDEAKGMAARITFYMADRYNLRLSKQQQQTLMAWDRQFPVSAWERERDRRIARAMGHSNPFVTGEKAWSLGFRPSGAGLQAVSARTLAHPQSQPQLVSQRAPVPGQPVFGNKRSGVYHLPVGCPSYSQVSPQNRVPFASEQEAVAAGYRKAGNCQ